MAMKWLRRSACFCQIIAHLAAVACAETPSHSRAPSNIWVRVMVSFMTGEVQSAILATAGLLVLIVCYSLTGRWVWLSFQIGIIFWFYLLSVKGNEAISEWHWNWQLFVISINYMIVIFCILPSVLWCCWLGSRKGIQPVKNLSGGMLAWLCVWVKVRICIWPSWCHCHSLSLAQ